MSFPITDKVLIETGQVHTSLFPNHSEGFVALLDQHMSNWRHVRKHLNDLPLGSSNVEEEWQEMEHEVIC